LRSSISWQVAFIWLADRAGTTASWVRVRSWSDYLAAFAALATIAIGISFAAFAAGGADSYGYVSEALLWADGHLIRQEPLASIDPILAKAAAPLGYQLSTAGTLLPIYSPGLPLVMAAAIKMGGETAAYVVVPVLGGLAVWLTYRLGRRLAGPRTGLTAAVVFACSPIFLFQLFMPMSDVPVTAWWLAALTMAMSEASAAPVLAGLASGLAVLTRPNLVPLAFIVAMTGASKPPRRIRLAMFGIGLIPGCVGVAIINNALYGSPLVSGYGTLDTLFNWSWIETNLGRYPLWLVQVHSLGILLGLVAPLSVRRGGQTDPDAGPHSTWMVRWLLVYCVAVLACYISYVPMEGWPFARFLLPAIPVLIILGAAVALRVISALPNAARGACLIGLCGFVSTWYVAKADRLGAFMTREHERRFVAVGQFIGRTLPDRAAILTGMHSGSVRLYGQRTTLQWIHLSPDDLDRALALLRNNGYVPYVLVEGDEEQGFRNRFATSSPIGRLGWPPAFEYFGHPDVRIYSLEDRVRYLDGQSVLTRPIP
jgi:hypothetical protein